MHPANKNPVDRYCLSSVEQFCLYFTSPRCQRRGQKDRIQMAKTELSLRCITTREPCTTLLLTADSMNKRAPGQGDQRDNLRDNTRGQNVTCLSLDNPASRRRKEKEQSLASLEKDMTYCQRLQSEESTMDEG